MVDQATVKTPAEELAAALEQVQSLQAQLEGERGSSRAARMAQAETAIALSRERITRISTELDAATRQVEVLSAAANAAQADLQMAQRELQNLRAGGQQATGQAAGGSAKAPGPRTPAEAKAADEAARAAKLNGKSAGKRARRNEVLTPGPRASVAVKVQ